MRETLDAVAVRRWCAAGLTALRRHEHEINQLNVYPVPDGDTGTNLVLTLTAAQRALAAQPDGDPAGTVLQAMARGALLGARGNSGVIVAQLLRGLADALAGLAVVGGREFADALTSAAKVSYAAVAQPVEGTRPDGQPCQVTVPGSVPANRPATVRRAAGRCGIVHGPGPGRH